MDEKKTDAITPASSGGKEEIQHDESKFIDEQKVPYTRFQQVNQEKQKLKEELVKIKSGLDEIVAKEKIKMQKQLLEELGTKAPEGDDKVYDEDTHVEREKKYYVKKLDAIEKTLESIINDSNQSKVDKEIQSLVEVYPEADDVTLRAFKQFYPDRDLERFAKHQHEKIMGKINDKMKKTIEEKKKQSQSRHTFFDNEDIPKLNIKEEDRPKTMREAREKLKGLIANL